MGDFYKDTESPSTEQFAVSVLSSSVAPIVLLDPDRNVQWRNEAAIRLLNLYGIPLTKARITLPHKNDQDEFDVFLSDANPRATTWILQGETSDSTLIFRCRAIVRGEELLGYVLAIYQPSGTLTTLPDLRPLFGLTPAEMKVVKHLVSGMTADELASHLEITLEAARTHIRRVYNKMGVSSREKLIAKANLYRVP